VTKAKIMFIFNSENKDSLHLPDNNVLSEVLTYNPETLTQRLILEIMYDEKTHNEF